MAASFSTYERKNNMENIALIRLAPGRVGFYDPLSRIHLTIGSPNAYVPSGTNCANLRRNVKNGVISLVDGTLGGDIPPLKVINDENGVRFVSNAEEANKPVFGNIESQPSENNSPVEEEKKEPQPEENKDEEKEKEENPAEESEENPAEEPEENESGEEESSKKKKAAKKK
mgnify:CR=1 FL=1